MLIIVLGVQILALLHMYLYVRINSTILVIGGLPFRGQGIKSAVTDNTLLMVGLDFRAKA